MCVRLRATPPNVCARESTTVGGFIRSSDTQALFIHMPGVRGGVLTFFDGPFASRYIGNTKVVWRNFGSTVGRIEVRRQMCFWTDKEFECRANLIAGISVIGLLLRLEFECANL